MRSHPAVLAVLASLTVPTAASAAVLPGQVADGPLAAGVVLEVGQADVAPDGTGGVAYVKAGDVWVVPLAGGGLGTPVLVEGLPGASSEPRLAAADGGRLVVVFQNGGELRATVRAAGGSAFGAPGPVAAPQAGHQQDDPSIDVDALGRGWVAWHETNGIDDDARAARVDGASFTALPGVLDTDDALRQGGRANNKPGVAVAVDGAGRGVVAFAEGLDALQARRLDAGAASAAVPLDPASYQGRLASASGNRNLEQLSIAVDGGGVAWIGWREQFDDAGSNRSRALVRPLDGLTPGEVRDVDGHVFPNIGMAGGEFPRVAAAGGHAVGASYGQFDGRLWGARFGASPLTGARLDLDGDVATNGKASPAIGTSGAGLVPYSSGADAVRGRVLEAGGFAAGEELLSGPFGTVGMSSAASHAGASPLGDVLVAFRQRTAANEDRLVVALLDQPPVAASGLVVDGATARWTPARDLWGAVTQEVRVDGAAVGSVGAGVGERALGTLAAGSHTVEVVATDARGQSASSGVVTFVVPAAAAVPGGGADPGTGGPGPDPLAPPAVDRVRPTLTFKAPSSVRRVRGRARIAFVVRAKDAGGLRRVTARCGTRGVFRTVRLRGGKRTVVCATRKRGTMRITVRATDRAGNRKQRTVRVRVR